MSITSLEEIYFTDVNYLSFEYTFLLASKQGNLDLIKWLFHYDYKDILYKYAIFSFCLACENNNLDIVEFIYKNMTTSRYGNTISQNEFFVDHIDHIFNMAFEEGYTELIIWLHNKFPEIFDSMDLNLLFLMSCENNYIELIRWIFSINPNIRINMNKDNIFIKSCRENNIDLASLFVELRPNGYYIEILDNEIFHFEVLSSLIVERKIEMSKLKNFDKCYICYENDSNILTKCNHLFCFSCIENHYYFNDIRCPYCRTENNENELSNIVNSV